MNKSAYNIYNAEGHHLKPPSIVHTVQRLKSLHFEGNVSSEALLCVSPEDHCLHYLKTSKEKRCKNVIE